MKRFFILMMLLFTVLMCPIANANQQTLPDNTSRVANPYVKY